MWRTMTRGPRGGWWVAMLLTAPVWAEDMPVYYDYVEAGRLQGGRLMFDSEDAGDRQLLGLDDTLPNLRGTLDVTTIISNGPTSNRIDLVMIGDGYTEDELDLFAVHVENVILPFFEEEPLVAYATYFNVHQVDVISNESGVDEPDSGIFRDTALDMAYDCGGIPRLLCINVGKALAAADLAPDVDQILALANSTRYGGAGYTFNNLGTLAGDNPAAIEIALHEFGHSFAELADEYVTESTAYPGGEPTEANISTFRAFEMAAQERKWFRWLDLPHVDTYQGAGYYPAGLYRPTFDSKMRSLSRPFEEVNVEQFIINIYRIVSPVDAATAVSVEPLSMGTTFFVVPLEPVDHALDVQWFVDGVPVAGAVGQLFTPDYLSLAPGLHSVSVIVVDNTPRVRDEALRAALMTFTRQWEVEILHGDCDVDGDVDLADFATFQCCYLKSPLPTDPACGCFDFDGSDAVDLNDFQLVVDEYTGPLYRAEKDCNSNGLFDELEVAVGLCEDCNQNNIPDECEFAAGTSADCNSDGVPDMCQLADNDCDEDGVPDDCQIALLIVEQPTDVAVCRGDAAQLAVVGADALLSYRWFHDGAALVDGDAVSGAMSPTLTIAEVAPEHGGVYWCVVADGCLGARSESAVLSDLVAVSIADQPVAEMRKCRGNTAFFAVGVEGSAPVTYVWHKDGAPLSDDGRITGAGTAAMQIADLTVADNGAYTCWIDNWCAAIESDASVLEIETPIFTLQPEDACGPVGGTVELTAEATAPPSQTLGWRWRKDGVIIQDEPGSQYSGARTNQLTISEVTAEDAGVYSALVFSSNPVCLTYSVEVTVTVGECE